MSRIMRNTAAVLVVTLFTGIAVFMTVQLAARVAGPTGAGTQAAQAATPAQESVDDGSAGTATTNDSWRRLEATAKVTGTDTATATATARPRTRARLLRTRAAAR